MRVITALTAALACAALILASTDNNNATRVRRVGKNDAESARKKGRARARGDKERRKLRARPSRRAWLKFVHSRNAKAQYESVARLYVSLGLCSACARDAF